MGERKEQWAQPQPWHLRCTTAPTNQQLAGSWGQPLHQRDSLGTGEQAGGTQECEEREAPWGTVGWIRRRTATEGIRWERPEAPLNSPLQWLGGLCQDLGQEPGLRFFSAPQPRMNCPGLLPSFLSPGAGRGSAFPAARCSGHSFQWAGGRPGLSSRACHSLLS